MTRVLPADALEIAWIANEHAEVDAAALDAALSLLGAPAFVVAESGEIVRWNAAGRELARRQPAKVVRDVRGAIQERDASRFAVKPFATCSGAAYYLVVLDDADTRLGDALELAARAWELTPKQRLVLGLLADGHGNKTAAIEADCALGTIELHVTTLLRKSGARSRVELVNKMWALSRSRGVRDRG